MNALLAWYFVAVWGSGYIATKIGLQYAAPFTFLSLRYVFGLLCMLPVVLLWRTRWPRTRVELWHVVVAGLLMHAVQLGGTHYAQYLGMSAGVIALVASTQPVITALLASRFLDETPSLRQWSGIALGLAGIVLVVWHKLDIRELGFASVTASVIGLAGVTAATLYQRTYAPQADLKAAAVIQFAASLAVLAPLGVAVEGFRVQWAWQMLAAIAFLVILASILAVSVLHILMRRGEASRVGSMLYLPPIFAVGLELAVFGVVPSALAFAGIAITCLGVAMTVWRGRREVPAASAVD
jgi:drug/metabolite transporter (DMT)-like permease